MHIHIYLETMDRGKRFMCETLSCSSRASFCFVSSPCPSCWCSFWMCVCLVFSPVFFLVFGAMILLELLFCLVLAWSLLVDVLAARACVGGCVHMVLLADPCKVRWRLKVTAVACPVVLFSILVWLCRVCDRALTGTTQEAQGSGLIRG